MRKERGAVMIFVTICLVVLFAIVALALDLSYLYLTRNELQNISDSASLAATRYLGHLYEGLPYQEQSTHDFSVEKDAIKNVAKEMGSTNVAATKNITINDDDILIGRWNFETRTFEEITGPLIQPTAVKVIARRDSSSVEGPVSTFFARILNKDTADVNTLAVASLSSQSTVEPGKLIPVGISEQWFTQDFCDQPITFYPANSPTSCAGWNVFFGTKISDDGDSCAGAGHASANCLRTDILQQWLAAVQADLTDPSYQTPGAVTGDFFEFTGGNLGNNVFEAFFNLFNFMRLHDEDGNDNAWTAQVVVYKSPDCSNPQGSIEILGFATATITGVWEPSNPLNPLVLGGGNPEWYIEAKVICEKIELGRGGGGEYGTYGSIPNLVK